MKKNKYVIILITACVIYSACKRDSNPIIPLSSLNVVNAISDQSAVEVNTLGSGVIYSSFPQLYYGTGQVYSLSIGSPNVSITLPADTLHPFFSQNIATMNGGINSLYIYGQSPSPGTLLLKDNIPTVQDSSAGVRFINLSPDSQPIKVNLLNMGNTEFSNLTFKQISEFKMYSAKSSIGGNYSFEIRDVASGNLLTTYTWYFKPFFCQTLVISGSEANNTINVFSVNNF